MLDDDINGDGDERISGDINDLFREYSEGFDPDDFFGYDLYGFSEKREKSGEIDSDNSVFFKDLLARNKPIKAIILYDEKKIDFFPSKYARTVEDLTKLAAEELTNLGNYESAFIIMEKYVSDIDLVRPYAENYVAYLLMSFREVLSQPEKFHLDFVDDVVNYVFYLEDKYFPQGLVFNNKNKRASVTGLLNGIRVCSFFDNYFERLSFLDKEINNHIFREEYEKVPPLLKLKEEAYSDYSGFSFIRYAPFK